MKSVVVTLPDGSTRTYDSGTTIQQVADSIGKRLGEAAVAGKLDGEWADTYVALTKDAKVSIVTNNSKDGLEVLRHSTAHLLAMALKELYPGTQLTIGPVIEDGYFYDVDCPQKLTPDDLPKIEKKMEEIAARKLDVRRLEMPRPEAIAFFKKIGENYKVELIEGFPANEPVSAYQQGEFIDLCRGPHVPTLAKLGRFKLLSVAGAYWRGDEKNKMLQRVYGTAFATQKELDQHLANLELARARDHRKLGPELGLFTFLPVAPAMPFFLPKGTIMHNVMIEYMRKELKKTGYHEVVCPQVLAKDLWRISGHLDNYSENMFFVQDGPEDKELRLALKPMNCPGHITLFGSTKHSYRELPYRLAEFTKVHRNERAGVTHGILRVRNFGIDDGHVFCTTEQVESEALALIQHAFSVYQTFGLNEVSVKLATRPESYTGTLETWALAEEGLANALKKSGKPYEVLPGEGAFYGPKIELHVRDSLGRAWQCGTIQLDYANPERFQLEYIDSNNSPKRPVIIHRAIWGSLERFLGILVEHYGGHFPLWLAPVQVVVINVSDEQKAYADDVANQLEASNVRVERDSRNEKLGYKIREAQLQKIPFMVVIGQKEVDGKTLSVRKSSGETLDNLTMEAFRTVLEPQLKPGGTHH